MDNKKKFQQQYMKSKHMHAARDNIPKGDWGWSAVIPASLKKVHDDLEKAWRSLGEMPRFKAGSASWMAFSSATSRPCSSSIRRSWTLPFMP